MNDKRHKKVIEDLEKLGWKNFVIWECEASDLEKLQEKLIQFFS